MKNKKTMALWDESPVIYPNELLDSLNDPNIKMAATMLAMQLRSANPGRIIDVLSGIAQEIETHWNGWNIGGKMELDIRRLRCQDNEFNISIDKMPKKQKLYVEENANIYNMRAI